MKIGIANDHAAFKTKEKLKKLMINHEIIDFGCFSDESVDYPDFAIKLAEAVKNDEVQLGIVMCGTGIGVSIACNKVKKIRCAKIDNESEAKLAKEHNNANILAFGANYHSAEEIKKLIDIFLDAEFLEGRHKRRIEKIARYEQSNEY